jgi:hypothetical protein
MYKKVKPRICKACGAKLKRGPRPLKDTADINRLTRLMKKYSLTQDAVSKIIGIAPSTVNGWLSPIVNPKGIINKTYFNILKSKGYK